MTYAVFIYCPIVPMFSIDKLSLVRKSNASSWASDFLTAPTVQELWDFLLPSRTSWASLNHVLQPLALLDARGHC